MNSFHFLQLFGQVPNLPNRGITWTRLLLELVTTKACFQTRVDIPSASCRVLLEGNSLWTATTSSLRQRTLQTFWCQKETEAALKWTLPRIIRPKHERLSEKIRHSVFPWFAWKIGVSQRAIWKTDLKTPYLRLVLLEQGKR